MAKTKIGINGMGRIGRAIIREIVNRQDEQLEVVAVNNPGEAENYVHLLKYDSLHGPFKATVEYSEQASKLSVNNHDIAFFTERDPKEIPWNTKDVDIVIDASGVFKDKEGLARHLGGTVQKAIMCAPGKNLDGTFVYGVNHETYQPAEHHIISNASCTTNCLAPMAQVIHREFGIINGLMTTIHAYTSDQQLLDGAHRDPRRARAAALSMIPTTTGAAKAVGQVIPELKGKLDGYAIRVPTPDVSFVDLTVNLEKSASAKEINQALKDASHSYMKGVLAFSEEPLVSIDYMGNPHSSIIDSALTNVIDNTAKITSWYDNEIGFTNRVIDLTRYVGDKL